MDSCLYFCFSILRCHTGGALVTGVQPCALPIATPFSVTAGRIDTLRKCRVVVTADADTRLPAGVVGRLVGTLARPLDKARFDPASGQVERGYTIIQPRVELAPDTTGQSLFSRFYGGDTAIDIYPRAVSDVYQAILGSGVYVGKGV